MQHGIPVELYIEYLRDIYRNNIKILKVMAGPTLLYGSET